LQGVFIHRAARKASVFLGNATPARGPPARILGELDVSRAV
jgi:hypothetical protein